MLAWRRRDDGSHPRRFSARYFSRIFWPTPTKYQLTQQDFPDVVVTDTKAEPGLQSIWHYDGTNISNCCIASLELARIYLFSITVILKTTSQKPLGPFRRDSGTSSNDASSSRNSLHYYAHRHGYLSALAAVFSTRRPPQSIPMMLKHIHTI